MESSPYTTSKWKRWWNRLMESPAQILVVDDETDILDLLEIFLRGEGYEVVKATNGVEALQCLERKTIDLVILDIMMPHMDGIRTCLHIRKQHHLPIIMLSAKSEDVEKITGLSSGADDYVTKPFNPMELMARVKSQLRRSLHFQQMSTLPKEDMPLVVHDIEIYSARHEVWKNGDSIRLTPLEFEILHLLATHRGIVFGTAQLYERIWQEPYYDSANTVMVHIRKIREKIDSVEVQFISVIAFTTDVGLCSVFMCFLPVDRTLQFHLGPGPFLGKSGLFIEHSLHSIHSPEHHTGDPKPEPIHSEQST
jgi:two-component system, OmpR family, response regulator VanR